MIPDTRSGLAAMACVSAMQKAIRRGLEREAMQFACELLHTSKAFHSMVCNRLEVICHEDLDTIAAPHVFPFVAASLAASRDRYSKSIGEARLMVGSAIRMMGARRSRVLAVTSLRPSGFALNSKVSRRRYRTTRSISTRWQAASWGAGSTISAPKARCWSRRRQSRTSTRARLTACGRSSSRASKTRQMRLVLAANSKCLA